MSNLADILVTLTLDTSEFSRRLRETGQELNNFRNQVRQVTRNMENDFSQSMANMGNSMDSLTQTTQTVEQTVEQTSNTITNATNNASRSSRNLARTLGTSLRDSRRVLVAGTREFRNFGGAGHVVSEDIRRNFGNLPRHLQRYVQRLQEAGQSTASFARLNELYGRRMIDAMRRSNDYAQNRTTQSQRLMDSFSRDTNLAPLTNQFLQLGNRMEQTARRGSALNIALQRIGNDTSMRNLQEQMRFVQQGIARARGAFLVFGITAGLATYGMIKLASAVDKRVAPAFERMKGAWLDAMMPFIKAFATGMVAVMDFVTAIGKMVGKFSEAHPLLFNMIMAIGMLTLVLGALLAPLAVTGVWAEGVAASFYALWTMISSFALGVLAVIGVALALATAIVVVFVSIQKLLQHSEAFKGAWVNIFNTVKKLFIDNFITPVLGAWERLKTAFMDMIHTLTGGEAHSMGEFWKWLGDRLAVVINFIANMLFPILKMAFQVLAQVVVGVIFAIIDVMNWLGQMWKKHGDEISNVAMVIWSYIQMAFTAIKDYIMSIMPQIKATISSAFEYIKAVIGFVMTYIAPVVVGAFMVIWNLIKFLMPTILSIIVGTWNNIKAVISSTIAIIQNVFQLFTNILKGNWKGAWENVKAILKNAVILIWNLIQLYFLGRLLAPFKGFITAGKGIVTGGFKAIVMAIKTPLIAMKAFFVGVFNAIKTVLTTTVAQMRTNAVTKFDAIKTSALAIFNTLKTRVTSIFNAIKTAMTNPVETAKNAIMKIIGKIVGAFASMKISIPQIKLPKLSIGSKSKTIMGKTFSVPDFKVSWNAKGGIFNGASLLGGGQGVGEAGAEAVLPVQHKRYMRPFANAVASHLAKGTQEQKQSGGDKYEIIFNQPVVIREESDIQRIVDELERRKRIAERSKGVFSY